LKKVSNWIFDSHFLSGGVRRKLTREDGNINVRSQEGRGAEISGKEDIKA
jgi:hypothetical protein